MTQFSQKVMVLTIAIIATVASVFMLSFFGFDQVLIEDAWAARTCNANQIKICHATSADANPYNEQCVSNRSVDANGHMGHTGSIYFPGITGDWGDIIPPVPGVHGGLNWNDDGQAIWNNSCNLPGTAVSTGTLIVQKVINNNDVGTKTFSDFLFRVDGEEFQPFEADGSTEMTMEVGNYSITEQADADYETAYDNCANVAVAENQTSTCTVTNTYIVDEEPPADPFVDLSVTGSSIAQNRTFTVGDTIPFEMYTINYGTAASGEVNVKWFLDDVEIGYGSFGPMQAGAVDPDYSDNVRLNLATASLAEGNHALRYFIDADNHEIESNEGNNQYTVAFILEKEVDPNVSPTPTPTPTPSVSVNPAPTPTPTPVATGTVAGAATANETSVASADPANPAEQVALAETDSAEDSGSVLGATTLAETGQSANYFIWAMLLSGSALLGLAAFSFAGKKL